MNEKLQESAQYLRCCSAIEIEAFKLYQTLAKKFNQPESSFILGLAYDSLKATKLIQGIMDYFDLPELQPITCKKNLSELANEVSLLSNKISKINNLSYELSVEILKECINLEDLLSEDYTNYLQSTAPKMITDEFSKVFTVNLSNFKKVLEALIEEKGQHRQIIIEIIYWFEAKQAENLRQITPIVKYQNPDSWIHESTLHAFSSTPAQATSSET
jgi:hypothetical protein